MEIIAADIGGTHARFAIAEVADGRVLSLSPETVLRTEEHGSLQLAWEAFGTALGRPLPRAAGIAVATPVQGDVLKFTNNPWIIRPKLIPSKLGLDAHVLVNDFGAVGHAVAQLPEADLMPLAGPSRTFGRDEIISIVGPGTGLGVACVVRDGDSGYRVVSTEGGHTDFAPLDALEDRILLFLRARYRRVSTERIVSGPGLRNLYDALSTIEGRTVRGGADKALWEAAMAGSDALAVAALDRFCLSLGAVAGDIALAQGATAVVIAGGLGLRIARHLPQSGFAERFVAKGRFEARMASLPVRLITHPQPGLFGAAAAFAREHAR